MKTTRTTIDSGWTVTAVESQNLPPTLTLPPIQAEVPGSVHLDLHRAGVIPDPFYRLHERDVAWVDDTDWIYKTSFHLDAVTSGTVLLRFLGLDTIAEITLNGEPVGQSDNMFVPHEFEVHSLLRAGENTLEVLFRSARPVGRERLNAWSEHHEAPSPHPFLWDARSFVRKAQYMFGWDWGPVLISCGIWRPVELLTVPCARLLDPGYSVHFNNDGARVRFDVAVERAPEQTDTPLALVVDIDGEASQRVDVMGTDGRIPLEVTLEITDPVRWSPDNPRLYPVALTLQSGDRTVDELHMRIGLRTVELKRPQDADGAGEGFLFSVNGHNTFCRGANWIPADSFPSRTYDDAARLRPLLTAAKEAGFNMLRVWGGGMYESDTFYDLCDEIGILVWQDFPYACAYYPDDRESLDSAAEEATAAVRRLRIHPSLALWCGNNENQQMFADNWQGLNPPHFLGQALYEQVFPKVVAAENPDVPYWPGSAYGGDNPNSPDIGDRHNWDVWHGEGIEGGDWPHYAEDRARFCSEFGFASACGLAAWDTCLAPSDRSPTSAAVQWHDKTGKAYDIYLGYIERHFPEVRSLDDLVYFSQLNQAEAMKFGVEHYRRLKGRCWGTLIWQLNDCWPVQSWAMIDYLGEHKAVYHAAKRFYAPVLLSLVRTGETFDAHIVNDREEPVEGDLTIRLARFDGTIVREQRERVSADVNGAGKVATIDAAAGLGDGRDVYVHASLKLDDSERPIEALSLLSEPRELHLPPASVDVHVHDGVSGPTVTLRAQEFQAYVWLNARGLGPLQWSDNFFHLVPGEERIVSVSGDANISAQTLQKSLDVRCLNPPP